MSSYDERNAAQIRLDELIRKYENRAKECGNTANVFDSDEEVHKQIMILISDLKNLKVMIDKHSKKGGKLGNKI